MTQSERQVTRERLAELLNQDLSREYQAIIAYVVYSQVLKGAESQTMRWPSGAYRLLEISCGTYQMGSRFSAGAARASSHRVMSREQSLC
jgi:hypothetical protein